MFTDLSATHVEQEGTLGLAHRKAQTSRRQQLHALEAKTQHVHRVFRIEAVHLLEFWPVDALLSAFPGQPLLLCLEVSEIRTLNSARDDLRRKVTQLATTDSLWKDQ